VIHSPAASEQVINQVDADKHLGADNDTRQQQSIAQTVSEITPTARYHLTLRLKNTTGQTILPQNEGNFYSVSDAELEQNKQQEVSIRPLYPNLTRTPQGPVRCK
jgi:hypothetical protein